MLLRLPRSRAGRRRFSGPISGAPGAGQPRPCTRYLWPDVPLAGWLFKYPEYARGQEELFFLAAFDFFSRR